jgi:hypothetical protein
MKTYAEKRAGDRHSYPVPIEFSYFNKNYRFEAQTQNHCAEGMCFKSNSFLKPGAIVYIRVKNFHPNNSCTGLCHGLHSVSLAETKWCKEFINKTETFFEIGVKYFAPEY